LADHRCQKRLSLDRRTAIARTPAGGGAAVATTYLWCGSAICQARDATNAVTREYYAEGELVPGTTPATYYYGADQIGSVRRVFASASSAPAYSYDPYGVPLQATAPLTDFTYAGMFHDADSGLDLTQYRAYDPIAGRWLSRDPLGEASDPVGNLYLYVGGNPISIIDPLGLCDYDYYPPTIERAQWFLFEEPPITIPEPPLEEFPTDPASPPAPGYEWRGAPGSNPGDPNGNWYNPNTGETLRPDVNHKPPIGPHYDYKAPDKNWYRWFHNGTMSPKA
jgi:RHS repeat-associated protein